MRAPLITRASQIEGALKRLSREFSYDPRIECEAIRTELDSIGGTLSNHLDYSLRNHSSAPQASTGNNAERKRL
jgi:hypothetical protein